MNKKQTLLSCLLMTICVDMANAQKAYTYIQQNDEKIDKLGTAAFALSSNPSVEFVDGKAVMTIDGNSVAQLPMSNGGQMAVEFETTMDEADLNKVTKTSSNDFSTIYSPFQLAVPSEGAMEVYAPTYSTDSHELICNAETKIAEGSTIPVETALLLKNASTMVFTISSGASTISQSSALSGSSLKINTSSVETESGNTIYTLGHEANDASKYGFFCYTGANLNAGLAWLVAPTFSEESKAKYVYITFDDIITGVKNVLPYEKQQTVANTRNRKYIENNKIVILRNNQKYNLNGLNVR